MKQGQLCLRESKSHLLISPGCSHKGGVACPVDLKILVLPKGEGGSDLCQDFFGGFVAVSQKLYQCSPECQDWGGVKPILAMPRFWELLDWQPLPFDCSLVKLMINVIWSYQLDQGLVWHQPRSESHATIMWLFIHIIHIDIMYIHNLIHPIYPFHSILLFHLIHLFHLRERFIENEKKKI